jgi:hypothetical protein
MHCDIIHTISSDALLRQKHHKFRTKVSGAKDAI